MKFKQLEIEPLSAATDRSIRSNPLFRSLIFIVLGGLGGFLLLYFSKGKYMDMLATGDIVRSILFGAFFGFFITNSPCARNKC